MIGIYYIPSCSAPLPLSVASTSFASLGSTNQTPPMNTSTSKGSPIFQLIIYILILNH
jgi:hypothetical protein